MFLASIVTAWWFEVIDKARRLTSFLLVSVFAVLNTAQKDRETIHLDTIPASRIQ